MASGRRNRSIVRTAVIGLAAIVVHDSVQAQAADAGKDIESVSEVVVTATKRLSTVQTTAMSISATTGEDLLRTGIEDVGDLALRTPGASLSSQGPGRSVFTIRGMSPAGGTAPTVGYYLDETPITPPPQGLAPSGKVVVDPNLYDLARVEVLRGPQGTLYGAGSMGGTIRLITNPPKLGQFDASAQVSGSDTQGGGTNYGVNAMLNLPLGERFAFRVVGTYKDDDGFIDRIVLADFPPPSADLLTRGDVTSVEPSRVYKNVNDLRLRGVRAALLGQVTDAFTVKASVFHQELRQNGQNTEDIPRNGSAHYQAFDVPERFGDQFTLYNVTASYEFAPFTISSSSSITRRKSYNDQDDTENYYSLFGIGFFTPGPTFTTQESTEFSQELRATSNGTGRLQWIVGGFFDNFRSTLDYIAESDAMLPFFGSDKIFNFREKDRIKQYAFFGEASYQVTDRLTATVGLRYFHYDFRFRQDGVGIVIPPINERVRGTASDNGLNPKVTLSYTPGSDTLVYATAAKGFRPGAPNGPVPGNVAGGVNCADDLAALGLTEAPQRYGPDTVWNYEVGGKFQWLQKRLQLNAAAYHLDWSDLQQSVALRCGFGFTANVGKAKIDGAEVELVARLGAGITLTQSVGYVDARITDGPINADSESRLQSVPKWTISSTIEFEMPLSSDWTLNASINRRSASSVYEPPAAYPLPEKKGFALVNSRVGLSRGKISANLYVDNLTNKRGYYGYSSGQSAGIPSTTRAIPTRPRTIGIEMQWTY